MNRKRAWTDYELGVVMDTMDQPAEEVAADIGRTAKAVRHKRQQLRDGWARVKAEAWSPDEDDFLRSVPDFTPAQVARHLGRTREAVLSRRRILGLPDARGRNLGDPSCINRRPLVAKTCTRCGLLLDATWFGRDNRGGWKTSCIRCRQENMSPAAKEAQRARSNRRHGASDRSAERLQALSLPHATRHGQPYVERDDEVLRNPDLTNLEKAISLGRTYKATVQQVSARGHVSKVGRGDPAEVQWIIRLREGAA